MGKTEIGQSSLEGVIDGFKENYQRGSLKISTAVYLINVCSTLSCIVMEEDPYEGLVEEKFNLSQKALQGRWIQYPLRCFVTVVKDKV